MKALEFFLIVECAGMDAPEVETLLQKEACNAYGIMAPMGPQVDLLIWVLMLSSIWHQNSSRVDY